MKLLRVGLLWLCATALSCPAQGADYRNLGTALATRFSSGTYASSGQVRAMARLPDGSILIASDTLSSYVEAFRNIVPFEVAGLNDHGFSALAAAADGTIWLSSAHDLGFIAAENTGQRRFVSLREQFQSDTGQTPRGFTAVCVTGSKVWFVEANGVHEWNGSRFASHLMDSQRPLRVLKPVPSACWVWTADRGVLALTDSGLLPLLPPSALPENPVWLLAPANTDEVLPAQAIARLPDGWLAGNASTAFTVRDGQWEPLPEVSELVSIAQATCALALPNGDVAIGTQNSGVILMDRAGGPIYQFDHDAALNDNHVLTLWSDLPGELWVGTATGAARVLAPANVSTFLMRSSRGGNAPRSIAQAGGNIFAATPLGVHAVAPGTSVQNPAQLVPLPPPPAPIWTLCELDSALLAGGVGGFWRWNGRWEQLASLSGTVLAMINSRSGEQRIYFLTESALHSLEARAGEWQISTLDSDLGDRPVSLVEIEADELMVSTMSGSILRIRTVPGEGGRLSGHRTRTYSPGAELPESTKRPRLAVLGSRVIAYADNGFFVLNDAADQFLAETELSHFRGIAAASAAERSALFWLVDTGPNSAPALVKVEVRPDGTFHHEPLKAHPPYGSVRIEQAQLLVQSTPEGPAVWVPTTNGLYRFGAISLEKSEPPGPVHLSSVGWSPVAVETRNQIRRSLHNPDRPFHHLPLAPKRRIVIPTEAQALRFGFFQTPGLRRDNLELRLLSVENEWSVSPPFREVGKLAPGQYELQARAIDEFRRSGPIFSYRFEVLPPWYRRGAAWLAYALILALAVFAGVRWRVRRLERQNAILNRLVDERTRELALANAQKSDFLASISHEIRNPLNGVTGLVDLLNSANLGPRERQLAQSLAACARSLRRVFDEVLGFTRLEQGSVAVHSAAFSISAVLNDARDLFAADAAQRGVAIRVTAPPAHDLLVGDDAKIRTIVNNFIGNALKYAPGAPIDTSAETEPLSDTMVRLTLEVRDHGPGIPPEEQELIFKKFVRGSSAQSRRETGAGLGLATCQALAQLMGGSIGVESPNRNRSAGAPGATFFLQLDLPLANATAITALSAAPMPLPVASGNGRALVVEDQEYNQLVARNVVERLGFAVEVAGDGARARDLISREQFDLILLDWDVPGAKGDELAREIRRGTHGGQPLIIALTAHDTDDVKRCCTEAGMDAFLVKPLEQAELTRTMDQIRAQRSRDRTVDFGIFSYLGHNDPEKTRSSAEEYQRQLERELTVLKAESAAGNVAAVARIAHRLRAHAAVVRFEPLVAAARTLQERCTQLHPEQLAVEVDILTSPAEQLREELRRYLT